MNWFKKRLVAQPPYDLLTVEQQRALYFLLEYFSDFARSDYYGMMNRDAINYLEKAKWYLGLSDNDVRVLRPHHKNIDNLYCTIKDIPNRTILDYMVNNCFNLIVMAQGEYYRPSHDAFYGFWDKLGYSPRDIEKITQRYMYRTDI